MPGYLNLPVAIVATVLVFFLARWLMNRQMSGKDTTLVKQILLFFIIVAGLVAAIISLPDEWIKPEMKNAILSFIGVILSAAFALSSTSLLGNAFAGLMIRAIRSFKPGDFIKVEDHFGRVSERGLFHVEVQRVDRGFTTLPNLYMVTHPVEVTRPDGPVVHSEVSLGYDVSRRKIEKTLKEAAEQAELTDPFVYIDSLGDFSVVYKVYGVLKESDKILTAHSRLNAMILDKLHEAGIEIVSPTFMNQRQVNDITFIPKKEREKEEEEQTSPEELIFDKAMQAESIEKKREKLEEMKARIKEVEDMLKESDSTDRKEMLKSRMERIQGFMDKIKERIDEETEEMNKGKK